MRSGAVDLSNYTTNVAVPGSGTSGGLITDAHCQEWIANGFTHAVIGTQWPEVTKHQLEVCHRNGMTLDIYTWLYWNRDITKYVGDRIGLANGYPVGVHWLDAEDDASGRAASTLIATIQTAVNIVQAAGQRAGIYTARWWWPSATGNTTAFSVLPLWHAEYPFKEGTVVPLAQAPSLDSFKPYGGWKRPAIWQYCGSVQTMGANLDLNVMDAVLEDNMANLNGDGSQRIVSEGNFIVTYNGNVAVQRVGSTDGKYPGRMSKNFGGNWLWFRTLNDQGQLVAPYWSDKEGD